MTPEERLLRAIFGVDPESHDAEAHTKYHAERHESCPEAHGTSPSPCNFSTSNEED